MAYSYADTHLLLPSQGAGQVVLATSLTEGPGRQMQLLKPSIPCVCFFPSPCQIFAQRINLQVSRPGLILKPTAVLDNHFSASEIYFPHL